ncbi:hypothetical protein BD410DRAFT_717925 [Rickenella mellea]|uniref:Amidohydrolase-related domain-containing protein n=1 Tax=Rickenella mellea TaxID=50990 RepID=A0A4Y7QCN2_9AGAM|nr:hypothetical protein BD410DRAFT_717925 [Rickenella mellea]
MKSDASIPLDPPERKRKLSWTAPTLTVYFLTICLLVFQCNKWYGNNLAASPAHHSASSIAGAETLLSDPSDNWKDDRWPIHEPTPWDISTDFPYPRTISYDVREGTWLRLDVHPHSGDIVFDMVGDLYCLPKDSYAHFETDIGVDTLVTTRAQPITRGVPHDADPHFTPDGKHLMFRSDAGLGYDNIWAIPWTSCDAMDLSPSEDMDAEMTDPTGECQSDGAARRRKEFLQALRAKDSDESLLASGVHETEEGKRRRLVREGREYAVRITNSTYYSITDPRPHPSGNKIVATKWYTSSRSIGAGEGWIYNLPHGIANNEGDSNYCRRALPRPLPPYFPASAYGDVQIGPEQAIWAGNDRLVYSMNVRDTDGGVFEYSKDTHKGIYSIFARDLKKNVTTELVPAFPGGASRPEISRDGKTLAFVSRRGGRGVLMLMDMISGTIDTAVSSITPDLSVIFAPMGTYPSFAFTPSSSGIIIWSDGGIWYVPLKINERGERGRDFSREVRKLDWIATIEKKLAETTVPPAEGKRWREKDTERITSIQGLAVDDGRRIVFEGAGRTYYQDIDFSASQQSSSPAEGMRIPHLHAHLPYYSPAIIPNTNNSVILHASFASERNFTRLEIAHVPSGVSFAIDGLPTGRWRAFSISGGGGRNRERTLAMVRNGGDLLTGDVVERFGAGLWLAEFTLPEFDTTSQKKVVLRNIRFIPCSVRPTSRTTLRFLGDDNSKLLVQHPRTAFVIDVHRGPVNSWGEYAEESLAKSETGTELILGVPADVSQSNHAIEKYTSHLAFVDFFHVFVLKLNTTAQNATVEHPVFSKPGHAPRGLARVSLDGGHDIAWTSDGSRLFWMLGPYVHSLEISRLSNCADAIATDGETFGIECTKKLLDIQELHISFETDTSRLKRDAHARFVSTISTKEGNFDFSPNADVLFVTNATLLTMNTGNVEGDLTPEASLLIRGGKIEAVGDPSLAIPEGASVLDAQGAFVVPGFIDVHAHWGGFATHYPARSWELETFLAYGVTTLHNPSSDNVLGSIEHARVESGAMIGPRIFHTGNIIYGGGAPGYHQDAADMAEARSALVRIKAEGGEAALSYKNYGLPSRAARQRLLLAARNLSMLCVPEGGMNQDWDMTYIIDGMTTIEHALPIPTLYDDVLKLYAQSGTGATPTHIVNYGGTMGEQLVWEHLDIPNDPKLRRFTRHDILEGLTESTSRPSASYALFNTSSSVAKMVKMGLLAHIGAHGEPPLGLNYHAEMHFTQTGGLSNYEVFRAATIDAAKTLGLDESLGSLSPKKLADFVIYQPGVDILHGGMHSSTKIRFVLRGGRVRDAATMVEEWPIRGKREAMPPINGY